MCVTKCPCRESKIDTETYRLMTSHSPCPWPTTGASAYSQEANPRDQATDTFLLYSTPRTVSSAYFETGEQRPPVQKPSIAAFRCAIIFLSRSNLFIFPAARIGSVASTALSPRA